MKSKPHLLWFKDVDKDDGPMVGGKGANLGEMTQAGFPVPNGFIVTAPAYFFFLDHNHLRPKIKHQLENIDVHDPQALNSASKNIKRLINQAEIPQELGLEIIRAYHTLGANKPVAVRSSATAEDLPGASFAGQQETFLNVVGDAAVVNTVRKAWASLFEPRAIFYRVEKGFDHFKVGIAIPVQTMVQSDVAGVMFTINPTNNDKDKIIVEAIWGLGEKIVQGSITPDHYQVNKNTWKLHHKEIVEQRIRMIRQGNRNVDAPVPKKLQTQQKITDEQIIKIAKLGQSIQKHYFFPQDIEWAIENNRIYITQTRPITTMKEIDAAREPAAISSAITKNLKKILSGDPASPGIVSGPVINIKTSAQNSQVKAGDILVTEMTTPDFVPVMKKVAGIITDKGGQTSHAAIVSRELGVPCIVGTGHASKLLKTGKIITIDSTTGDIYEGGLPTKVISSIKSAPQKRSHKAANLKTATKVYVNVAEPSIAVDIGKRNVDGVGLLRAEFMIAEIGTHPRKIIEDKKQKEYIKTLSSGLEKFCASFGNRPVVYRATDFKTNEYRNLTGGKHYEPEEENPMLGFRGAYRYLSQPEVFELELAAIKYVRNKLGYKNLWLMIPFVHTVAELIKVKRIIAAAGLSRSSSFKLWMMVEIPSNVILLEDFINVGIDGISIGSNDLTMLTLGTDRDNQELSDIYDERNPAVLWMFEKAITTAKKMGVTSSMCGQAPSLYPDLTQKLVEWGITSVSVSPDMIDHTKELIYDCELRKIRK